jgi:CzcA family heavy metal efflux pump
MIDAMIRWSLERRLVVLFLAAGLTIWGWGRARELPVDVFPDLSAPTVTVIAEAHGMAPAEVERQLTAPLEASLQGAGGVRRLRSASSVGVAVVWVEFDWGTDIHRARQVVAEKVQVFQATRLPGEAPPVLGPISSIMGEVLFIGLGGEGESPRALRTLADQELRRRLLAVPGVSQVVNIGGEVRQLQVIARPEALARHGISLEELIEAVRDANQSGAAGAYTQSGQEWLLYGDGRARGAEALGEAVVRGAPGPVLVRDLAEIVEGGAIQRGDAAINDSPGVVLGIQKQPEVNTLALTKRIDAVLDEIEPGLPRGVILHRSLLRQADFIQVGVDNVAAALRDGALLVVLIIGVFLMSGRATLITALAIPLSLLVAALALEALGLGLDTMALGGMAIAVGALVDDAIIDVENVARRLREAVAARGALSARERLEVVFHASREVRGSIVFATLIIMLVFAPIFALEGVEGLLLAPLGLAYVVSLGASLLVALTVTPALCLLLLPRSRAVRVGAEPALVRALRAAYERALRPALPRWWLLSAAALAALALAGLALASAGRAFLPEFNEGALTISVVSIPGTSLAQSNLLGHRVEELLLRHPEVVSTARRTGRAEQDEHAQGVHASEVEVALRPTARGQAAFLAALRRDLQSVSGASIIIGQPISHRIDHMLSGTRANVAVKIFGPDLVELQRLGEAAEARMARLPGVVDLSIEQQSNLPSTRLTFRREALARYGLRAGDLTETLEAAFYGHVASRMFDGAYGYDVVVRYPAEARAHRQAVAQTLLPTPSGAWAPLEALVELTDELGPYEISREDGQRKLVVQCNVGEGEDLGGVVSAIQGSLAGLALPPGYYIEYGGQFEAAQAATRTLGWLSAAVVLGIFLLLYVALGSGRDAALVMLNLPLALIGGVAGVYLGGGVVSVASLIGFITLFGVATRNGIMLVTHIRHLREEEGVTDPVEAVLRGASERLSPILMTTLASGLGLLPLALAQGAPGSELQAPMALVILCGLVSSTALNLVLVPAVMLRFGSARAAAQA